MKGLTRRRVVATGLAWPLASARAVEVDAAQIVREGGVVIAFRHALAPGTFDPPGFKLGDCRTQRNLDGEGRAQARRIGAWFAQRELEPERVRSSPWCRCMDTAALAFGRADSWAALGSPRGASEGTNAASRRELRAALAASSTRRARFEVWVTHMFVLTALTATNTASGEGLILRAEAGGQPVVIARLTIT